MIAICSLRADAGGTPYLVVNLQILASDILARLGMTFYRTRMVRKSVLLMWIFFVRLLFDVVCPWIYEANAHETYSLMLGRVVYC